MVLHLKAKRTNKKKVYWMDILDNTLSYIRHNC